MSSAAHQRPDLAGGVAVFPLPGVVLFPRMRLPLHIFEPRYKALLEATMTRPEAERCFAMGAMMPYPGDRTLGDPPVYELAGMARVVERTLLADGRSLIVLEGVDRIQLSRERQTGNPWREFEAAWLDDLPGEVDADFALRLAAELRALVAALLGDLPTPLHPLFAQATNLNDLVWMASGYIPWEIDWKLEQLACQEPLLRAGRLIGELEKKLGLRRDKPLQPDAEPDAN